MTVAEDTPLVVARGVARTFGKGPTAVVAVHGVDCVVRPGEMIALSGPSGSGKTTLLHLLAGLDTPTTGSITWPALGDRGDLRPGPVAVVFQAPSLLPALDVLENVALPLLLRGEQPAVARRCAAAALARLRLDQLTGKLPEELSGGQAQRVAVARVLAGTPRLVFADEPTGQLDHGTGLEVVDSLIAATSDLGAALVVNTHDPAIAERFPIRWHMLDGHLRTGTTTDEPEQGTLARSRQS